MGLISRLGRAALRRLPQPRRMSDLELMAGSGDDAVAMGMGAITLPAVGASPFALDALQRANPLEMELREYEQRQRQLEREVWAFRNGLYRDGNY